MKKLILPVLSVLIAGTLLGQENHGAVHWYTLEEAMELRETEPRPLLIDVYTAWCGWCKRMEATTYSDPQVASYINQKFYAVQYDAEGYDTISFLGKSFMNTQPTTYETFKGKTRKPGHQLAKTWGVSSYPTTLFYNEQMGNTIIAPGYLDVQKIQPFLVFYGEKAYQSSDIEKFRMDYDSTFFDQTPDDDSAIKWYSFQEALDVNRESKEKKKIFLHYQNPYCTSCKVMEHVAYEHPVIAAYLKEHYLPVKFDVFSKDTLVILNQTVPGPTQPNTYHPIVGATLKNNVTFPSVVIFNEQNQMIGPVPQYMTDKFLEAVLVFFEEDKYQDTPFPDFMKAFEGEVQ